MEEIKEVIARACKELFGIEIDPILSRPDEQFGDYSTNAAMQLAGKLGKNPREIADKLAENISSDLVVKTEVAGPGFINLTLSDEALVKLLHAPLAKLHQGKVVVAEYSDPNPFKELHAGHLYTSVVGDAISRLYESAGAEVHRVNFGGDVGLHVAKTIWAALQKLGGENPERLVRVEKVDRANWLSQRYVEGNKAYEESTGNVKDEIQALNKKIYQIHAQSDKESKLAQIYWATRQWSYEYFDEFYAQIGVSFEKYYPESETVATGLAAVESNIGPVFEKSDGAIIFNGDVHNLHTRVFINSAGLPTYETKDLGLALIKWKEYKFDVSLIITGNDIVEYMKVVLAALERINDEIPRRTKHLTHGMVKLAGGEKMSSRKGNVLKAEDILAHTRLAISGFGREVDTKTLNTTMLGAVKYSFLKSRMGGDIIYDPKESVSLEGNSGPYLQYSHARARSILSKKEVPKAEPGFEPGERSLVRKISEYPEVVEKAVNELMPHHICTYLYELAQAFNSFYEHNRVIGNEREAVRLNIVEGYAETLKNGLDLLGIPAPDKM